MTRSICLIAILALLPACAPTAPPAPPVPAGHQSDEETAVLAAMDRYMTAISANDLQAMAAMQTPEGMRYRARATEGGSMEIEAHPNSYWVDSNNAARCLGCPLAKYRNCPTADMRGYVVCLSKSR